MTTLCVLWSIADCCMHASEVQLDEKNERFGQMMRQDIQLRTQLFVCAVCSEYKNATELKSFTIKANVLPQTVRLDEKGIISHQPIGRQDLLQFMACSSCQSGKGLSMRNAQWNCAGLGHIHGLGGDIIKPWYSEEALVATVVATICVRHAGQGGFSFKQEAQGAASFMYHNVLLSMMLMLGEIRNAQDELHAGETINKVEVMWVRAGQQASKCGMMVRVRMVMTLFIELWKKSEIYRLQCLQNAGASFDVERVTNMIQQMQNIMQQISVDDDDGDNNSKQHSWPWKVTAPSKCKLFVTLQYLAPRAEKNADMRLFIQAFPCMFPALDSFEKVDALTKDFSMKRFAEHMARLSDQRLMHNDRALFVLNNVLMKYLIMQRVYAAIGTELPSHMECLGNLKMLVQSLERTIKAEREKDAMQPGEAAQEQGNNDQQQPQQHDYRAEMEVKSLIGALKFAAREMTGHPMSRAWPRQIMKALNRNNNPGCIWLTINVNDHGNTWLQSMYRRHSSNSNGIHEAAGADDDDMVNVEAQQPGYEVVKGGAFFQAMFFDAMVKSLMENVIKPLDGSAGLFGELDWAGGMIEWCQDGTSHLHLIGAAKTVAPDRMAEMFSDEDAKERIQQWVGTTFCEQYDHPQGTLLQLMMRNGDEAKLSKLLHVHSHVCTRYQKLNKDNMCRCRFGFAKEVNELEENAHCELDHANQTWKMTIKRDDAMALPHCNGLAEVSHSCGGMPNMSQYCQFVGAGRQSPDGLIQYVTNYTTKLGMPRLKMMEMLLEEVKKAQAKYAALEESNDSDEDAANRVRYVLMRALKQFANAVAVPQAQAALNVLGMADFHCTESSKLKIAVLFGPPFVEHVRMRKEQKRVMQQQGDGDGDAAMDDVDVDVEPSLVIKDYIYRGVKLDSLSPWEMKKQGWEKKKMSISDIAAAAMDDNNNNDDDDAPTMGRVGVAFSREHPEHATHWMVQKKQKQRGKDIEVLVHVTRKSSYLMDDEMQKLWVLSIATSWRSADEVLHKADSWNNNNNNHDDDANTDAMTAMKKLLRNELMMLQTRKMQADGVDVVDEQRDEEKGDWVSATAPARTERLARHLEHKIVQTNAADGDDDEDDHLIVDSIGGESGASAVAAARCAGLIPRTMQEQDDVANAMVVDVDDEHSWMQPKLMMSLSRYNKMKATRTSTKTSATHD